jgi:hypothetical protein
MKKFAKVATPAAIAVLRQATAISPSRKKASDGLLPSAAHRKQSPNSDHNTGLAVDLTHDPKKGIDCVDIFQKLKEDKRHNSHLHISINGSMGKDTSPWFWWLNQPKIVKQIAAKVIPIPSKKAYKTEVCTCCKLHGAKP